MDQCTRAAVTQIIANLAACGGRPAPPRHVEETGGGLILPSSQPVEAWSASFATRLWATALAVVFHQVATEIDAGWRTTGPRADEWKMTSVNGAAVTLEAYGPFNQVLRTTDAQRRLQALSLDGSLPWRLVPTGRPNEWTVA